MSMFFPRIYETTLKTGDTTNHSLVNEGTRPFTKKKQKCFNAVPLHCAVNFAHTSSTAPSALSVVFCSPIILRTNSENQKGARACEFAFSCNKKMLRFA